MQLSIAVRHPGHCTIAEVFTKAEKEQHFRMVDVLVRLQRETAFNDPVYEKVSRMALFDSIISGSQAHALLHRVYRDGLMRPGLHSPDDVGALTLVRKDGGSIQLTDDRKVAFWLGTAAEPITAIQAAFHTGNHRSRPG